MRNYEKPVPKLQASILGLLSSGSKAQTAITRSLTNAGYKKKEDRDAALSYLIEIGEVKRISNIVPLMGNKAKIYAITELGLDLIDKINNLEIEMKE